MSKFAFEGPLPPVINGNVCQAGGFSRTQTYRWSAFFYTQKERRFGDVWVESGSDISSVWKTSKNKCEAETNHKRGLSGTSLRTFCWVVHQSSGMLHMHLYVETCQK